MQEKDRSRLYIQLSRHNEVQAGPVRLAQVSRLYGVGAEEKKKLGRIELMCIKAGEYGRYSLSAGEIADKILKKYPWHPPVFLGDPELVLEYPRPERKQRLDLDGLCQCRNFCGLGIYDHDLYPGI